MAIDTEMELSCDLKYIDILWIAIVLKTELRLHRFSFGSISPYKQLDASLGPLQSLKSRDTRCAFAL